MGRTQLERAVAQLEKEIEKNKNYKKKILNYVEEIKNKRLDGEITHYEYEKLINQKLEGKTIQEWLDFYDSQIKYLEKEIKKQNSKHKIKKILLLSFFSFIFFMLFLVFYLTNIQKEASQEWSPSQEKPLFEKIVFSFTNTISDSSKKFYNTITGLIVEEQIPPEETGEPQEQPIQEPPEFIEEPAEGTISEELINIENITEEEISNETGASEQTQDEQPEVIEEPAEEIINEQINETEEAANATEEIPSEEEVLTPILIKTIPNINIKKNSYFDLDLTQYFKNSEEYYFLQVKNILTSVDDSIIKIQPDENFSGVRETKIIAINEFGNIESNSFNIIVSEEEIEEIIEGNITEPELIEEENITLPENITQENVTIENLTNGTGEVVITIQQYGAVIGQPVKWSKHIQLENLGEVKYEYQKNQKI